MMVCWDWVEGNHKMFTPTKEREEGRCAHTRVPLCHHPQLPSLWCQEMGMCMNTYMHNYTTEFEPSLFYYNNASLKLIIIRRRRRRRRRRRVSHDSPQGQFCKIAPHMWLYGPNTEEHLTVKIMMIQSSNFFGWETELLFDCH
jgi:hypothetical protein